MDRRAAFVLATCLVYMAGCNVAGSVGLAVEGSQLTYSWPDRDDEAIPEPVPVNRPVFLVSTEEESLVGGDEARGFLVTLPQDDRFEFTAVVETRSDRASPFENPRAVDASQPFVLPSLGRVVLTVRVKKCFEIADFDIEFDGDFGGRQEPFTRKITVRNVAATPEPDPEPDPDPVDPTPIKSNIAQINGHDTYVQGGDPFLFVTGVDSAGSGLSEIHNLKTGALEHTFTTVPGRDGTVACTPDGKLFFTVLIDDGSGFVRFETFDAATDNAYVSPDFIAAQWIMGASKLPFVPVLLDKHIFTAPGAEFEYDVLVTWHGPVIDGDPTVQPWVPASTVSSARRQRRGIVADTRGMDILAPHWNAGEGITVVSRRESGPTDNPANFFAPILTIPATTNELRPFGDSLLAWKTGDTTGYLYRRDGSGDLTVADGTVTLPADIIDSDAGTMGLGETDRAFLLLPGKIVELTVPDGAAPSSRDIALPTGKGQPVEFNVIDINGKESAVVLFGDGPEIIELAAP